jgi:transmembrane sensor
MKRFLQGEDATVAAVRNFLLRQQAENNDERTTDSETPVLAGADLDTAYAWDVAGVLASDPSILQLRASALETAARFGPDEDEDKVAEDEPRAEPRKPRRKLWIGAGMALAASICAIAILQPGWNRLWPASSPATMPDASPVASALPDDMLEISTEHGQRRMAALEDGSTITLDSMTRIFVASGSEGRRVRLVSGRALFDVKHSSQPFIVESNGGETIDLGTRFVVENTDKDTRVSLIEGKVSVRAKPSATPVDLLPGETVSYARQGPISPIGSIRSDPADWTRGHLVFDDTRLADAVATLSRYSQRPIEVADSPHLQNRRVNGLFLIRESENFAPALANALDLRVEKTPEGTDKLVPH